MAKDRANLFRNIRKSRQDEERQSKDIQEDVRTELNRSEVEENSPSEVKPEPRKTGEVQTPKRTRGRPATGKRSDPDWIGRTYYVRRDTDLDVEGELLNLKRQGIEIDKSELVDFLLAAWVKWRNGEDSQRLLDEISPRRNGD